jgi:hypothetical protein
MARTARATEPGSYDALKEFGGRKYTGMKVGRGHHWHYDAGEWVEKKLSPDRWEFSYAVKKRRHGKAPAGSGVPVGTAYHWYILADQTVTKLDANTYSTSMSGAKFKLAHQRADKASWSASERARRKRLIQILEAMIAELRAPPEESEAPAATAGTAQPAKPSAPRAVATNGKRVRAAGAAKTRATGTGKSKAAPVKARARRQAQSRAAA